MSNYDTSTGEVFDVTMDGIEHSPSIGALAGALAKAQSQIQLASKDAFNPHFKNKYADLAAVWEACRTGLSANDISVIQSPFNASGGSVGVLTMLAHKSGEWMKSSIHVKPRDFTAQGVGSIITYLRRYSLSAMVGIAPSAEDDDGNAASGRGANNSNTDRAQIQAPVVSNEDVTRFEQEVAEKVAKAADPAALDTLWRSGISARLREIGQVDPSAQRRMIDLFGQRKKELATAAKPVEAAA